MKRRLFCLLIVLPAIFISCGKDNGNSNYPITYQLSGNANGSSMVPPVTTTGSATLTGTYSQGDKIVNFTVNWTGLSAVPVSGAFYLGTAGTNGDLIGTAWTIPSNAGMTGTLTGTHTVMTAQQEKDLVAGKWYFKIGTTSFFEGEIRGQVTATKY